ncbi:uncharacterized protein A4U43_C07F20230 [Asparagus officinalis]|uniref:WIYLD domain-containing protein n=1 Tax=Asparagus officinalis TaxID=4686 RepID=A0A5P1EDE8_ASPOF|nr:probable inactive histone-lysine N-methyltransferase SUVR1 isoform X1 [Asparagus officinalis]ONK63915.1 uncharacterized protein A4U43_C07F20230 [Asparagus officinalis]
MPPPPRARTALQAMKSIGFSSKEAAPILRKLLEVYENNWEYIEDNDYQVLIDSILEAQEAKASTTKQNAVAGDDPEHSRKRIRKLSENPSTSTLATDCSGETLLKKPKLEADVSPEEQLGGIIADPVRLQVDDTGRIDVASSQFGNRQKMTEPTSAEPSFSSKKAEQNLSPVNRRETRASSRAQKTSSLEENAEHLMPGRDKTSASGRSRNSIYLKEPKTEPDDEYQQSQVQANVAEALAAQRTQATDKGKRKDSSSSGVRLENGNTSHDASPSTIDIASSYTGAVKLQFSFKTDHPDFSAPSVDTVLKMVEEKCLQCHKISEPDFSLLKLMKEVCQFASELTNPSNGDEVGRG